IAVSVATPVHEPPVSEHEQEVTYSSIWEEESVPSRTGGTLRYIRKSSKTWMKMFTSFTGAVVTGLILGIIVLTFFSNEELADPSSTDQPSNQSSDMPPKDVAETDLNADAGTSTDGPSPLPVQVPAGSFVLLQNGVFTTLEAAEAAVTALRSQGFAAVMLEEEQYYVFAAVLTNRDDALALSQELQKSDFETFIK